MEKNILNIYVQKNEVEPAPHIMYKNYSKQINHLNVRVKITKLLEENKGINDLELDNGFLYHTKSTDNKRKTR